MAAMQLTRTHRILIGIVVFGAVIIAAIGFAGSYAAVRELAEAKGFGAFSLVFPIGIDAGICVLLALDLLLTWMRIPFPLLRQSAWLLTAATIAFNGAAAWPDPLGVGMHAVIPLLFIVSVEAARHAVGRIADITADKHMEGVRLTRWLLSPIPTFMLWRRMKLWEIRSYEQAVQLEQHRLVYEAKLQARFGSRWRRKAPVEALMPLRLAKYGVPLSQTAPHVLEEAGLDLSPAVTVERVGDQEPAEQTAGEQQVLEAGEAAAAGHVDSDVILDASPSVSVPQDVSETGPAGPAESVTDDRPAAAVVETDWKGPDVHPLSGVPAADMVWDSNQPWNAAADAAEGLELENSSPGFQAVPAGAAADRTGGSGRVSVQVRIPAQPDEEDPVPASPDSESAFDEESDDALEAERDQQREPASPPPAPSGLKGVKLVEHYYRHLPEELQQMSANELAITLAEMTGYKEGTVRKYIGDIRKAAAQSSLV
ncbi:DUF2637 domain-containing protein [Streptomyces scopuliridis]|uniref:DUF2637 domain-containing protein n=1 Tax=Streptomyces scopuliridis TaxID=452529 RepID=UPI00369F99A0